MKECRFCICEHCGNIVGLIEDSGVPLMCCGKKMTKLEAGTVEASKEKHIPEVEIKGKIVTVKVGSVEHPMTAEHSILWVYLQTDKGGQRKVLEVGKKPVVTFAVAEEKPLAVYAYCNLHGLWMTEIKVPEAPVYEHAHENFVVCKCNNVSFWDIEDELHKHESLGDIVAAFEMLKDETRCSTGCGGCHDKVMGIISDLVMGHK